MLTASAHARAESLTVVEAQARFEDGLDRARRGDNEGARIAFVQAYAVLPRAEILWNLALSEQRTGHTVEALRHFRQFEHDPKIKGERDKQDARVKIEELSKLTGHLEITAPAGSRVTVDGEVITDEPPLLVDVAPGYHAIDDRLGDKALHQEASPAAGETSKIVFTIEAPSTAVVGADTTAIERREHSRGRVIVPVVMLGVSVLAVAGGMVFALKSSSDSDHARDLRAGLPLNACNGGGTSPTCGSLRDTTSSQSTEATVSDALYIGAGVVAVSAALVYLLWPGHRAKAESAWIAPEVGPHAAGLDLGGRF